MYTVLKKLVGQTCPKLNGAVFNPRSFCNKTVGIIEYLKDLDSDLCLMTDTLLRKGDTSKVREVKDLGYLMMHRPQAGRGGGVALIYKKSLSVKPQKTEKYKSFEVIEGLVESNLGSLIKTCCVYCPGTGVHGSVAEFCVEFENYLIN